MSFHNIFANIDVVVGVYDDDDDENDDEDDDDVMLCLFRCGVM